MNPGSGHATRDNLPLVWSPDYEVDIGPHVFPTAKYRLVRTALLEAGVAAEGDFVFPPQASWEDVGAVHSREYVEKIRTGTLSLREQMTLELPFTAPLLGASLLCCGGTTLTAREALKQGVAVHLGGGFHHAFRDHGEGFCLLNDVAVAAVRLLEEGVISRCAVVDLDVHQGNGTAAIFRDDPRVFTLSMHQENNYPLPKPPSDLDLGLEDGIPDESYLRLLDGALEEVLSRQRPQLVIYLAGADPFAEDQLGGLGLTMGGLEERDRMVLERCSRAGAGVAVVLAGGYARQVQDTVTIHRRTVEVAREGWLNSPHRLGGPP
jgi:acetoin utilization deacetylase AcuC-like enzyme